MSQLLGRYVQAIKAVFKRKAYFQKEQLNYNPNKTACCQEAPLTAPDPASSEHLSDEHQKQGNDSGICTAAGRDKGEA